MFGGFFGGEAGEVGLAGLGFTCLFGVAAVAAEFGGGIDIAFGDLVPPLLLSGFPDLLFAAIDATEGNVEVVATRYIVWRAITVVRGKQGFVDGDCTGWKGGLGLGQSFINRTLFALAHI